MDKIQMQDRAGFYLNLFEQIRTRVTDMPLALVILQEIGSDLRQQRIEEHERSNGDGPATEKQLGYLRKLAIPIPENLTKREASRRIDEALGSTGDRHDGDEQPTAEESQKAIQWPRRIP